MKKILIVYVPVLHKGYLNFFKKYNSSTLYLITEDVIKNFPDLDYISRKDSLRALSSEEMQKTIESLGLFEEVFLLNDTSIKQLNTDEFDLVLPNEDVSKEVVKKYFPDKKSMFDDIFLRWHRDNTQEQKTVEKHKTMSVSDFEKDAINSVFKESEKSWDWWRQIGAMIIKNGVILLVGHNKHIPNEQTPYVFGDPRSVFRRGINFDLSTSTHAEASLIAEAAKNGIALDGSDIFLTDFPCPPCAKLIAGSGIKKCYFSRGYAKLDGESVLEDAGVELILLENKKTLR